MLCAQGMHIRVRYNIPSEWGGDSESGAEAKQQASTSTGPVPTTATATAQDDTDTSGSDTSDTGHGSLCTSARRYCLRVGAVHIVQGKTVAGSITAAIIGALTCYACATLFLDMGAGAGTELGDVGKKYSGAESANSNFGRHGSVAGVDLNIAMLSLLAGGACSVGELLPLGLDDNLALPIVAGLLIWPFWP